MVVQASDIITVNAGGREHQTSVNTLISSGSGFFQAMLGSTGAALSGVAQVTPRASKKQKQAEACRNDTKDARSIFVDRDPDVFADVLYYMRCNALPPRAKTDFARLEMLRAEAEFFVYDALIQACTDQLEALNSIAKTSLEEEEPKEARFESVVISRGGEGATFECEEGSVMYIDYAVLSGDCQVRRYKNYPKEGEEGKSIPGCYIQTRFEDCLGDFQLSYCLFDGEHTASTIEYCLAHVGLDHIHCGNIPMNVDFRQDIRVCLGPRERSNIILLEVEGAADWHVHYWIGPPETIPPLMMSRSLPYQTKQQKMADQHAKQAIRNSTKDSKEKELLMAAMLATRTKMSAMMLALFAGRR
jgi:hypothetical protein